MFTKPRTDPPDLRIWQALDARMDLTAEDRVYFKNLVKGIEGERRFDDWLRELPPDYLVLNDLLIETNQSVLQFDSLVIAGDKVLLFEVKSFEGDYYVDGDQWYSMTGTGLRNPLHQLDRSKSLLTRFLKKEHVSFTVEAYLVFVHPAFVLYEASRQTPIVFPGQLPRFFQRLQQSSVVLGRKQHQLAERLMSKHLSESPYRRQPSYTYEDLQKGICCETCSAFLQVEQVKFLTCPVCRSRIPTAIGILQSVKEFQLLFPDRKITTLQIHDWIGKIVSTKAVRISLTKEYTQIGHGRGTYYRK
ncbi:NERD domain-containing protein [Alteribacillus iranensis]|uniref:Nuclease-related domain-containing protein n=1 Tax=Alteribacillus iranensis TaxID=930128 RepID=A0A1I2BLJ1_9BACI|nr:NERD domain-containing protein [Alteribacillus iranensis]SFE56678.1 Nuclease-related domain-containing protein [Alteribacillus iranensis]